MAIAPSGFGLAQAAAAAGVMLTAAPGKAALVGPDYPETAVWAYGGTVPGPDLRLRRGEESLITLQNRLPEASSVHWHGLRISNAMDGVPGLTQAPVEPGDSFAYRFTPPDAGTFWYHSHLNGQEQVARGLSGVLIVEEEEPPKVDRELVWLIDDWLLDGKAAIVDSFDSRHALSHAGRLGNSVTINGRITDEMAVRAGERIRLRLINGANARVFALRFEGHRPWIVALDGQGCRPHEAPDGRIVLGPAMRADLIIDMEGKPGERFQVVDEQYSRQTYRFVDLAYGTAAPLRDSPLDAAIKVPANPMPEPDLAEAESHLVELQGGAMGGMAAMVLDGERLGARALMEQGFFWALNGVAGRGHALRPMFSFQQGRSQRLIFRNATVFDHPMHLHGHHMKLLSRDGVDAADAVWHDTVMVRPRETVEVAFVADNPGDWLVHCHVLGHMKAGMVAVARVTS